MKFLCPLQLCCSESFRLKLKSNDKFELLLTRYQRTNDVVTWEPNRWKPWCKFDQIELKSNEAKALCQLLRQNINLWHFFLWFFHRQPWNVFSSWFAKTQRNHWNYTVSFLCVGRKVNLMSQWRISRHKSSCQYITLIHQIDAIPFVTSFISPHNANSNNISS